MPQIDLFESESAFLVLADMPGVTTDRVEVTVEGRTLTLRGYRERGADAHDTVARRADYRREVRIPESVDEAGIEASLGNGVLSLRLPKREAAGGRRIAVQPS